MVKLPRFAQLLFTAGSLFCACAAQLPSGDNNNTGSQNAATTYYHIISKLSGKYIQPSAASTNNGSTIEQQDATGLDEQLWVLSPINTNCYIISSKLSGKALDVMDNQTTNGTAIQQWDVSGAANQKWLLSDCGGGYFRITSLSSGKSLDIKDLSVSNGGKVQQWDFGGGDNQKWRLVPAGVSNSSQVWLTSADALTLFERKPDAGFYELTESSVYHFAINDSQSYQQMDGFGASMTESSAYLICTKLALSARNALMTNLFDPVAGIGLSFLRQPMGSPDFALSTYSYDDMPTGQTDNSLSQFSIARDTNTIIPLLKQALAINPSIKIMASPWSPPAWMKSGLSMIGTLGGTLNLSAYTPYAGYFVKFIQAYQAEGIPIYAVTPQNEPLYSPPNYSGMLFSANEELSFIKSYLGPAIAANGLSTKIICWDHNWDNTSYASAILSDNGAKPYVAGSGWHYYGGSADAMTTIHNSFPDRDIWFTEGGSGRWISDGSFSGTFMNGMKHAIRIPRNWSKTVVWWNIALNENNGPIVFVNDWNFGMVQINEGSGAITYPYRANYYTMAHLSKFVRPGAYRIDCPTYSDQVEAVAFKNTNNSVVLVVFNSLETEKLIKVSWKGLSMSYKLPKSTAATFVWN